MNLALQRNKDGEPLFDDAETIQLFWSAKAADGTPMLTPQDKKFLQEKFQLDSNGVKQ